MKTYNISKKIMGLALIAIITSSCKNTKNDFDATGTFESVEVIVSAEGNGKIQQFDIREGDQLTAGQQIGTIDTVQLYLRKLQLISSGKAVQSRRPDIRKQIATIEQQIATATVEQKRIENLVKANAANQKQLDDINGQIALLNKQLDAQHTALNNSSQGVSDEAEGIRVQIAQIEDQLKKCRIVSPIAGTVLVKYAEAGELATQGKALFKIADTNNMILRAYVTNDQLSQLKIGQSVKVLGDFGERMRPYQGTISWIASKAEFTPKTIQTKDERANLVYAIKVNVKNDGYLKIGMYGSAKWTIDN